MLLFINSSATEKYQITISPSSAIQSGKQVWLWDPESGERYKMPSDEGKIFLDMGPADLKLLVFDKQRKGPLHQVTKTGKGMVLTNPWLVTGQHVDGRVITNEMPELKDLKETPEWVNFCGTIVYRNKFTIDDRAGIAWMDIGKAFGVSDLIVNGVNAGVKWYGRRIYSIHNLVKGGNNDVEIKIVTTMGNYLKSLADNPIAQYWTNEGRTIQPLQSTGLVGPVTVY
jgi:hypothetical protein